jgi:hypothetical protein
MVIRESLGVEAADRWRRAHIEQALYISPTAEEEELNRVGRGSGIGVWLMRVVTALTSRFPRRSTLQAAPQV